MRLLFLSCLMAFSLIPRPVSAQSCGQFYQVKRGDSLSSLARVLYGDPLAYSQIFDANVAALGGNPDILREGTSLFLPCAAKPAALPVSDWNPHLTPEELAALLGARDLQIVDLRAGKAVQGGTVKGAISMPYGSWRGPKENPGAPPSDAELSARIGAAGLRLNRPIVLIHGQDKAMDTGRAAYVYWMLKSLGAREIALLKGGFAAWRAGGHPEGPAVQALPYTASLTLRPDWRATRADVEAIAEGRAEGTLLDSRPEPVFRALSKLGKLLPRTLPGARNSSAGDLHSGVGPGGGMLDVFAMLKETPVAWGEERVVSFCSTGELGALNWFYASEVSGFGNVQLYPESVRGWKAEGGALVAPDG